MLIAVKKLEGDIMNNLTIKTTIYDIFGYLMPGLLFICLVYISYLHSKGITDICPIIMQQVKDIDIKLFIIIFLLSYIIGHATSTLSSLVVENLILLKLKIAKLDSNNVLPFDLREIFKNKFKILFNVNYDDKKFRAVICYVESTQPSLYSTAFIFLSFYGMARNIAFVFTINFIIELINLSVVNTFPFIATYILFSIAFYHEYYRFFIYFKEHILFSFCCPNN